MHLREDHETPSGKIREALREDQEKVEPVRPRIALETEAVNRWGLPDTSGMAPAISAARRQVARVAHRKGSVDPVTTELVRIRNARYQNCYF